MNRATLRRVAVGAVLAAVAGLSLAMVYVQGSRAKAEDLARHGLWPPARRHLQRYLWLHPRDGQARLLMAEALVKDDRVPNEEAVEKALEHLGRISDHSPQGAIARTQEGRLLLLLEHKPARAERSFRRAIELDPNALEAHDLLWRLMVLTRRSDLTEEVFWRVYELTPEESRGERLREWYMSQFYPVTASSPLDRAMGILGENESPTAKTEAARLINFRNSEPDEPLAYAALARWFIAEGDPKFALEVLAQASEKVDNAREDSFFLAALIECLIDLGEFERAGACFEQWPEPGSGYEFWKWQAIILDEVHGRYSEALEPYDRALSIWPGMVDWPTRFRKANCLARCGDHRGAEAERAKAKVMEELMTEETARRIFRAIGYLRNPTELELAAEFYDKLNRPREAACWRREIERLVTPLPSTPAAGDRES